MPILVAIAIYERYFRQRDRNTRSYLTPHRKPSMLHRLTNLKSANLLETAFDVDSEFQDDVSLFNGEQSFIDDGGSVIPQEFRGFPSPKRRPRVESEPSPFSPEYNVRRQKRKSASNLQALNEEDGVGLKAELEDIRVSWITWRKKVLTFYFSWRANLHDSKSWLSLWVNRRAARRRREIILNQSKHSELSAFTLIQNAFFTLAVSFNLYM